MNSKKSLLFCLCVFCLQVVSTGQQQDVRFTSLTTKDGLSSNTVNAILKDSYGFIWFGTEDGLDKFDGTNFTVYRHRLNDSSSLQANEILSIYEDKQGNLWIGTSGGSLSLYDRKQDNFVNFQSVGLHNKLSNNVIRSISGDSNGRLWIAHFSGIDILDPKTKIVTPFPIPPASSVQVSARTYLCVFSDSKQRIWIGTDQGLIEYTAQTKSFKQFSHSNQIAESLCGNTVNAVAEDKKGNIWICTDGGLSMLKPNKTDFVNYRHRSENAKTLSANFIYSVAVDGDSMWLGTGEGLNILNTRTGEVSRYKQDYRDIHSLTANAVRSIYISNDGIYWLGTIAGGVDKYDKNLNLFNFVQSNVFDRQGLNGSIVTSFAEDKNGKVFVGTESEGLSLFDTKTRLFQHYPLRSNRININNQLSVLALEMTRKHKLIVGTYDNGLFVLNPETGQYKQLTQGAGVKDLNSNDIFCIKELRDGSIWVGTNGAGVNVLNDQNEVIKRFTPIPALANDVQFPINGYIRDVVEDREGKIWIATHGGGIAVYSPKSAKFVVYNSITSKLPNDKVQSLLEDSKGNIWAGTFGGGLALFDPSTKKFVTYSEKDGLQNTTIFKVIEDKTGLIWVTTNTGISSINSITKKINNYNYHNGVQNNNFVRNAGLALSDGELLFGGLEGINYFDPASLKKNTTIPSVIITDLKISNQSIVPSEDGPIKEHISVAREINLDFKQNFALSFVGLSYTAPEKNQYAYKLEGFDKDWNFIGHTTTAAYTNLDPGEYVFRVKASNNDGIWNDQGTSIKIYVHPPFWRTIYAYLFYILAVVGFVFYLRYKGMEKMKRKFALQKERMQAAQERKETERIHELDRLKIRFLTNLSHEFRTPISLILGPVDHLLSQQESRQSYNQLQMIKRNGRRLLNLVNQLLDFRKMEEQELKLQESEGELVSFISEVFDSFKDLSERRKIHFVFKSEIKQLHALFDQNKIERILFNLLSNAFKFTANGGEIQLELWKRVELSDTLKSWVAIKVSDTGIGIPEDKKEKIFERFFQNETADITSLNQGSGIGLSITKEFVRMLNGTIEVESEVEKGTTFTILLPFVPLEIAEKSDLAELDTEAESLPQLEEVKEETKEESKESALLKTKSDLPTLLLVEDNDDFRFYLKDNLKMHYKVVEAVNGKEGWQKALAVHPQLIVSDISMSEMDGIELCRKIKSDKRTGHIPVMLLTALTGEEEQLKGLETGANDYITKPFNFEVLNAKIKNLLVLNSTLKNAYTRQIKVLTPEVEIESEDGKLLKNVTLYLEENLTNSQLSVEELSRHLGMSRSSLYSKLLELTGQTPVEYIRSVKLDKAAVLLQKSEMNVAQVAYSVGFSTPNYFAKSFKAKFNMLPSEYINKIRKEVEEKNNKN